MTHVNAVLGQALASAQAVTARAANYAQQIAASLPAGKLAPPATPPATSQPAPEASAMTDERFDRLRDHSQRIVDSLRATEQRIANGYDRVAQSLVARTVALSARSRRP